MDTSGIMLQGWRGINLPLWLCISVSLGRSIEEGFSAAARELSEEERISAFNRNMMEAGMLGSDCGEFAEKHGRKWLMADYEAGDVVVHDPFMVHASAVNEDYEGRIRLATDLRFVEMGEPFDERWMKVYEVSD
jgi:phytanoyl-CoA hydroxylase